MHSTTTTPAWREGTLSFDDDDPEMLIDLAPEVHRTETDEREEEVTLIRCNRKQRGPRPPCGKKSPKRTVPKGTKPKTRRCRFWTGEKGSCKAGDKCKYYHGAPESRVCRNWTGVAGSCPAGDRCAFVHKAVQERSDEPLKLSFGVTDKTQSSIGKSYPHMTFKAKKAGDVYNPTYRVASLVALKTMVGMANEIRKQEAQVLVYGDRYSLEDINEEGHFVRLTMPESLRVISRAKRDKLGKTWCRCPESDCVHVKQSKLIIYHNRISHMNPRRIFDNLVETGGVALANVMKFTQPVGEFYEFAYKVVGSVVFRRGEDMVVHESNCMRWLDGPYLQVGHRRMVWEMIKLGRDDQMQLVIFRLTDAREEREPPRVKPYDDPIKAIFDNGIRYHNMAFNWDSIDASGVTVRFDRSSDWELLLGSRSICFRSQRSVIYLAKDGLARMVRLCTKEFNQKNFSGALARARQLCKKRSENFEEFCSIDTASAPIVMTLIAMQQANAAIVNAGSQLLTSHNNHALRSANKVLKLAFPRNYSCSELWNSIVVSTQYLGNNHCQRILSLILLFIEMPLVLTLFGLIWWMTGYARGVAISMLVAVVLATAKSYVESVWNFVKGCRKGGAAMFLLFCCPGCASSTGQVLVLSSTFVVFTTLMILWVIHWCIRVYESDPWSELLRMVKYGRQVENLGSFDIPPGATIPGLETLINPQDYPMRRSARYKYEGDMPLPDFEEDKPGVTPIVMVSGIVPTIFSKTRHNLRVAILTRALAAVPEGIPGQWKEAVELMDFIFDKLEFVDDSVIAHRSRYFQRGSWHEQKKRLTRIEYAETFPPRRRDLILKALDKHLCGETSYKNLAYSAFVKKEKLMKVTYDAYEAQRPRLIQGLSDLAKALAGSWFKTYSDALKCLLHIHSHIWYSSGATAEDHDYWFSHACGKVGGIEALVLIWSDFSKYDLTQGEEVSAEEKQHYKRLGFCKPESGVEMASEILEAMHESQVYAGRGNDSFMFSVKGTRKSGDLNTSSGNSRVTAIAIASFFRYHGLFEHVYMVVLGDDNLTLANHHALIKYFGSMEVLKNGLVEWATSFGFKLKVGYSLNIIDAEYCSSRWYPCANGHCFGKKPGRTMCKIATFLSKPELKADDYLCYLHGTLKSVLPTANHVPFLRVFVHKLMELVKDHDPRGKQQEYKITGDELKEANADTWLSFVDCYGYDEEDELRFEKDLSEALDGRLWRVVDLPVIVSLFNKDFEL